MIPRIFQYNTAKLESISVTVTSDNVQFAFRNHRNIGIPFSGLLLVKISQSIPSGTTTTLPIVFTSEGTAAKALTTFDGEAVTVAQVPGTGVYLCFYDQSSGTLQLLTGAL